MSYLKLFIEMLDRSKTEFSVTDGPNETKVVRLVAGPFEDALVTFAADGHFKTATVEEIDLKSRKIQQSYRQGNGNDYQNLCAMVTYAPEKFGDFWEGVSEDGKYIGLIYRDYCDDYYVAFVCFKANFNFAGVVVFQE